MSLLSYTFFYVVAAILVFQGTHAVGEQSEPLGVVPEEVAQEAGKARLRGHILAAYGYLCIAAALASHAFSVIQSFLPGALTVGFGLSAAYGLYVVFFNRKVQYMGVSAEPAHHDHH